MKELVPVGPELMWCVTVIGTLAMLNLIFWAIDIGLSKDK